MQHVRTSHVRPGAAHSSAVAELRPTVEEDRPVFRAFPQHHDRLRALLLVDEDFADVCDDFDTVTNAFHRGAHNDPELVGAADEYHGLRLELESEILGWLRSGSRAGGRG